MAHAAMKKVESKKPQARKSQATKKAAAQGKKPRTKSPENKVEAPVAETPVVETSAVEIPPVVEVPEVAAVEPIPEIKLLDEVQGIAEPASAAPTPEHAKSGRLSGAQGWSARRFPWRFLPETIANRARISSRTSRRYLRSRGVNAPAAISRREPACIDRAESPGSQPGGAER